MDYFEVNAIFEQRRADLMQSDRQGLRPSQEWEFEDAARSGICERAMALYLLHIGEVRWHMSSVANTFWRTALQGYAETLGVFRPVVYRDWYATRSVAFTLIEEPLRAGLVLLDPWAFLAIYASLESEMTRIVRAVGPAAANRLYIYSRVMDFVRARGCDFADRQSLRLAFKDVLRFRTIPGILGNESKYIVAALILEAHAIRS